MGCRRSAWLAISILFAAFSNSSSRSFCGSSSAIMLLFFGRCIRMGITSAFMGTDISLVGRRRSMQSSLPIIATPFRLLSTNKKKQDRRRRKRRGVMHSLQCEKILYAITDNDDNKQSSSAMMQQTRTQYTINDSVCPPTDPNTLEKIVTNHIHTLPKYWNSKPIANHTLVAFEEALDFVMHHHHHHHHHHNTNDDTDSSTSKKTKVILDSGCGTGRSSILLGEMHTDCIVIGIDQSLSRLSRNEAYNNNQHENSNNNATNNKMDNVLLLRAELSDFWKCCLSSSRWQKHVHIYKHYLLYPNPYPKKSRLKSRFYAHPAFPLLMMISLDGDEEGKVMNGSNENEKLIVRSNWEGYLKEFKLAINIWNNTGATFNEFRGIITIITSDGNKDNDMWHPATGAALTHWEMVGPKQLDFEHGLTTPLTNFEAKYIDCGEPVYELLVHKSNKH